jgi:hypothetical protein
MSWFSNRMWTREVRVVLDHTASLGGTYEWLTQVPQAH